MSKELLSSVLANIRTHVFSNTITQDDVETIAYDFFQSNPVFKNLGMEYQSIIDLIQNLLNEKENQQFEGEVVDDYGMEWEDVAVDDFDDDF